MRPADETADFQRSVTFNRAGLLRWRAGAGWIVLGGGGSWQENETGDVDAAALGWADLDRPMAVVPAAGTSTLELEALLDYYADLGGPHGYVVPIFDAAGAQLAESCVLLADAGLIYLSHGPEPLTLVRALRESPAMAAIVGTFEEGAVIVGMGAGAAALGEWIEDADSADRADRGLGWLPDVIVAPRFQGTEAAHRLRRLLDQRPNCLGLGIPEQTALGLGPAGDVETVGPGQVTVVVSGLEVEA